MVTAVTTHFYESTEESPYIVQITMTGTGEAGIVEGEDKITVTVTDLPAIIVSAGDEVRVEEGDEAQLRGTFNRPVGVTNMRYRWDFGDGSEVEEGALDEGNAVETAHRYLHLRNQPYVATLTVTGESEAGGVEASTMVYVYVVEKEGWVVGGYDLAGNAQDAIRLFSIVVRGAVEVGIWPHHPEPALGRRGGRGVPAEPPVRQAHAEARGHCPGLGGGGRVGEGRGLLTQGPHRSPLPNHSAWGAGSPFDSIRFVLRFFSPACRAWERLSGARERPVQL